SLFAIKNRLRITDPTNGPVLPTYLLLPQSLLESLLTIPGQYRPRYSRHRRERKDECNIHYNDSDSCTPPHLYRDLARVLPLPSRLPGSSYSYKTQSVVAPCITPFQPPGHNST